MVALLEVVAQARRCVSAGGVDVLANANATLAHLSSLLDTISNTGQLLRDWVVRPSLVM